MKYLIVSDIHGNSDALEAVLRESEDDAVEAVLVLGDLVGYGAGPNQVIDRLRGLELPTVVIRGNHDKVVSVPLGDDHFNAVAREAIRWTTDQLTAENLEYLKALPRGPLEIIRDVYICHGSPLDEDEYLMSLEGAAESLNQHPGRLIFFGHTHLPTLFTAQGGHLSSSLLEGDGLTLTVEPGQRYLANPGSVGQPRDRDPRAAYFVFDAASDQLHWRRCEYPIEEAQRKIFAAGLPDVLAHRLGIGI